AKRPDLVDRLLHRLKFSCSQSRQDWREGWLNNSTPSTFFTSHNWATLLNSISETLAISKAPSMDRSITSMNRQCPLPAGSNVITGVLIRRRASVDDCDAWLGGTPACAVS